MELERVGKWPGAGHGLARAVRESPRTVAVESIVYVYRAKLVGDRATGASAICLDSACTCDDGQKFTAQIAPADWQTFPRKAHHEHHFVGEKNMYQRLQFSYTEF
jgi:hypothetical protein